MECTEWDVVQGPDPSPPNLWRRIWRRECVDPPDPPEIQEKQTICEHAHPVACSHKPAP